MKSIAILMLLFCCSFACAKEQEYGNHINTFLQKSKLFIENKGQIIDQYGKPRKDISFKLESNGMLMFVGKNALHYQWYHSNSKVSPDYYRGQKLKDAFPEDCLKRESPSERDLVVDIYRLDVQLLGANPNPEVITELQQDYNENYYLPQSFGGAIAHSYKKIIYRNVYPNIDWVIYTSDSKIKYDFVIGMGGNYRDIQIEYNGTTKLELKDGALIAETPFGSITENAPSSYWANTKQEVSTNFVLNGNVLSYMIPSITNHQSHPDNYRDTNTLVIDPVLQWSTYHGGNGVDIPRDMASDKYGNSIITGYTLSTANIATTGAFQDTLAGGVDAYVVKFNLDGQRIWSTYYGGAGYDHANSIACDFDGNIFLTGETQSLNLASFGAYQPALRGSSDAFLVKFNKSGNRLWATYFGGNNSENAIAVSLDLYGNAYVCGVTTSTIDLASAGIFQTVYGGGLSDGFLVKFNPSGARQWSTYLGSITNDMCNDVVCDASGNSYTGMSVSATGGSDGRLLKFDPWGVRLLDSTFSLSEITALACSPLNEVYIAGTTKSLTGIATPGCFQAAPSSSFIIKYNSSAVKQWGTYYGTNGISAITIDNAGNLYFIGYTTDTTWFLGTPNGYKDSSAGADDAIFASFTSSGARKWSSYFGGGFADYGLACQYNNIGSLYLFGETRSATGISTPGAFQTTKSNTVNGFLASFIVDTGLVIEQPFYDSLMCAGDTFSLHIRAVPSFLPGNLFTVLLSDSTGNFGFPAAIGSLASDTSCTILCTIPANVLAADGYRIRVAGSSPYRISPDNGFDIRLTQYPFFAISGDSTVCMADTLKLGTMIFSPASVYGWSGPNMLPVTVQSIIKPNVNYPDTGIYMAVVSHYGCSSQKQVHVMVKPKPIKPLAESNSPLCAGDSLSLIANTNTPGVSYSWTGVSGFTSALKDACILNTTTTATGDYIVSAILNGCAMKDTVTVIVKPRPLPVIISDSFVCEKDTLRLQLVDNVPGAFYNWLGPAGFSAYSKDTFITEVGLSNSGVYIVLSAASGCIGSDTIKVLVKPKPIKPEAENSSPLCAGGQLWLRATCGTPGVSFYWTGPDNFQTKGKDVSITDVSIAASGTYSVFALYDGCRNDATTDVQVKLTPPAPQTSSNSPVYVGKQLSLKLLNAYPGAEYAWQGPNSFSSRALNPVIAKVNLNAEGSYSTTATFDGCSSAGVTVVEIYDVADTGTFVLYPNPNNGMFTISGLLHADQQVPLRIMNAIGQECYFEIAQTNNRQLKKDISLQNFIAGGVYILQLRADGKMKYIPFSVVR